MKINLQNIGPIKSSTINLNKDLIILSGPNNTGKTYIAYCIYGLSKQQFSHFNFPETISKLVEKIIKEGNGVINLVDFFESNNSFFKNFLENNFKKFLPRIFGLDLESSNKLFGSTTINIDFDGLTSISKLILDNEFKNNISIGDDISIEFKKQKNSPFAEILIITKNNSSNYPNNFLKELISENIFESIAKLFLPNSYIAPVERNSIYTFSKELSLQRNVLIDKILDLNSEKGKRYDPFDLLERRATRYPLSIRDGLEISEDLGNFKKRVSKSAELADELEEKLLNGKILINKDGDVNFTPNNSKRTKLPIHLTASIVKSLSSLVLYLRHFAKIGDLIIIDEPELNLHPDSQILIARILAKLVNNGYKVLINTHSDYIVREINNLIMLSNININDCDFTESLNYNNDDVLQPERVGAYLFSYDGKNKVITKELVVDNQGFEVTTIDKVINQLNERTNELYIKYIKISNND